MNQQFDEHIKEQFSNYSPDVNPRIWENIIASRERRKPVGFWQSLFGNKNKLMLAALLLVIGSGAGWLFMNNNNSVQTVAQTELQKDDDSRNRKEITESTNTPEQQGNPAVLDEQNINQGNNSAQNSGAGLSATGSAKFQVYSPKLQSGIADNTADDNTTDISKSPSGKKRNKGLGGFLNISAESPGMKEDDDYATQGTLLGRLTFNAEKYSAKKKSKSNVLLTFSPIIYLPDCPSMEKDASGNKKYLEIYAGPDYAFRSLSDTGNSAYLQKRKESTKFSSAYSAGIRYTKVFNNSMSVRAGVNYSQINEKFKFTQGNLVQVTYIIDANGDTTGSYITTGTRYKTTINKYRSIDVPIVIGYEMGNGRLHANINAGIVVNIYSWQKGDVLDTAYQPVSITTGKNSSPYQFKTHAGVGVTGGVSVYYKLNDRIHLMAEPYFRYNFSPMNTDNLTLKQKYQTAGLRLGVRLDF